MIESMGLDYTLNDLGRKLTKNEINKIIPLYDYVIAGTEIYDRDVLNNAKKLKIISRVGVGLDNIDLDFALERKIKVIKTKTTPATAVSELTVALILNLLRKISQQKLGNNKREWQKQMGRLFYNKTLGIVGLGNIGKELVKITKGFNLEILAFDIYEDKNFAKEFNIKYCSLDHLLSQSDIVTLHLSMNSANKNLINFEKLVKMKTDSILINTSRGDIINEDDLIRALKEEKISGVALDVFKDEPYKGELTTFDNAILTPHIAAYAIETRIDMEIEATKNLINELDNE